MFDFRGGKIHTVDADESSRHQDAIEFRNDKGKMLKELLMRGAIPQVALAGGIDIERGKRWTKNTVVNGVLLERAEFLDAIAKPHLPSRPLPLLRPVRHRRFLRLATQGERLRRPHGLDHRLSHTLGLPFFASNVGEHRTLRRGTNEMHLDGLCLTKSPTPTRRLIEFLIAIRQTDKRHLMTALEVHPEPSNAGLTHQNANLPCRKIEETSRFHRSGITPLDFHSSRNRLRQLLRFTVQMTPY